MEYRIGDISAILNISNEMIRYYEKVGVIHPKRDSESKYRMYTQMDLYALLEAVQLKSFDINLKEVNNLKEKEYFTTVMNTLASFRDRMAEENIKRQLLMERADQLIRRNEMMKLNLGYFWVKRIPAYYYYDMNRARGDDHERITASKEILKVAFSEKVIPFMDANVVFQNEGELWIECLEKKYFDRLQLDSKDWKFKESATCLCTIVDMGDIGAFSAEVTKPLMEEIERRNFKASGEINGILIGRGNEDGKFRRYMELRTEIRL